MDYQHRFLDGSTADLPLGKIVCVGRNYAAHAKELNAKHQSRIILLDSKR